MSIAQFCQNEKVKSTLLKVDSKQLLDVLEKFKAFLDERTQAGLK